MNAYMGNLTQLSCRGSFSFIATWNSDLMFATLQLMLFVMSWHFYQLWIWDGRIEDQMEGVNQIWNYIVGTLD